MSTSRYVLPPLSNMASIESRVVPGTSLTMERVSPKSRLRRLDLCFRVVADRERESESVAGDGGSLRLSHVAVQTKEAWVHTARHRDRRTHTHTQTRGKPHAHTETLTDTHARDAEKKKKRDGTDLCPPL